MLQVEFWSKNLRVTLRAYACFAAACVVGDVGDVGVAMCVMVLPFLISVNLEVWSDALARQPVCQYARMPEPCQGPKTTPSPRMHDGLYKMSDVVYLNNV